MQEAKTIPHWLYQVLYLVAAFIGGGGALKVFNKLVRFYVGKPEAEVHRTEAEATEIIVRTHSTAGDSVIRMIDRLEETQERIDEIRDERDDLKMRYELQTIELNLRDQQLKKLKGILDANNIRISDYDHPKE